MSNEHSIDLGDGLVATYDYDSNSTDLALDFHCFANSLSKEDIDEFIGQLELVKELYI